jgi:ATP diphosphatase
VAEELGDLLFTVVNLSRRLGVDPELALRHTNQKFRHRFSAMESATDRPLEQQSPEQLEALWADAKASELSKIETTDQVEAGK